MKNKILSIIMIILILFFSIFALNCIKQKSHLSNNSQTVQNLTGEQISRLDRDVLVRFPATIIKRYGSNCIELFAQDDFKKYDGDGKHAIFSRFAFESSLDDWFEKSNNAIVSGKMTFVKDVTDTSKTCGIVTGNIFEITEIEYF